MHDLAAGLDGQLRFRQRPLGVAQHDQHVVVRVQPILRARGHVVGVARQRHVRHQPQRGHGVDEDRLAVGGEVLGRAQILPEQERRGVLLEPGLLRVAVLVRFTVLDIDHADDAVRWRSHDGH